MSFAALRSVRLGKTLQGIAALALATGCSSTGMVAAADAASDAHDDGGTSEGGQAEASSCPVGCLDIPVALACQIQSESQGTACADTCASHGCAPTPSSYCVVEGVDWPTSDGSALCPDAGTRSVCCMVFAGRLTDGIRGIDRGVSGARGSLLAARAYLEAASVFSFERLERELALQGAPRRLLRGARRARRDEVRHAAIQSALARKQGANVHLPERPRTWPARSLFSIALENAVEGCVRETYGAVLAWLEAGQSSDPAAQRAMRDIAADECRHAELAWAVRAWAQPRLSAEENQGIDDAMREAEAELHRRDPAIADLLFQRVWRHAHTHPPADPPRS